MKAIFLDRDGVLNYKSVAARYVRSWAEFKWIPGALQAIVELKRAGYTVLVISNQAGVGRGHMSEADLADIHQHIQNDLQVQGVQIDKFYCCTHVPDGGCACRKPKTGLLMAAQKDYGLDFSVTPFIGDDQKDDAAGKAVGCPTYQVNAQRSLLVIVREEILGAVSAPTQKASA